MAVYLSIDEINQEIKTILLRWLATEPRVSTPIEGLMLSRFDAPIETTKCFYYPMMAMVLQGYKYSIIGGHEANYGPNNYMIVGLDMPGVFKVSDCDKDHPFLSLSLKLDKQIIAELISKMPSLVQNKEQDLVTTNDASLDLMDAVYRLVKLIDEPAKVDIMAPLILREIYFYLLQGNAGDILRLLNTRGSQVNQLTKSIQWLRENFRESFQIEDLASIANMAPSTFFRHFKKATSVSPIQFQKFLRLYEAQRLMLKEGFDASTAALNVGYESVSQFNREYKRQFGAPPKQDVAKTLSV